MSEADGFLARWSRRKREARTDETTVETAAPTPAPDAVPPALPNDDPVAVSPEAAEPPPDLADLPPVESLTPDTDLAPFLRPGVPAALKNAALRRMWLLDPAIAGHRDVALDYAWDFNAPVAAPGFGGTITPDSVQAVLDRLIGPAEPEPRPDAAAAPAAEPPPAALSSDTPSAAASDPAREPAPDPAPPPRPRRHGGAIPV